MASVHRSLLSLLSATILLLGLTERAAMGSTVSPAASTPKPAPTDADGAVQFPTLSPAPYETDTAFEQGGSKALFAMMHAFLGVVQSNPLPKDLVQAFIDDEDTLAVITENYPEMATYEMGFLVCLAIGLLFVVLSPFVAWIFCCCRCCCSKCGGRMHQSDAKARSTCRRVSYSVLLLVSCVFMIAGLVCVLQANLYTHHNSEDSFAGGEVRKLVKSNIKDINIFAESTLKQLDEVVAQFVPVGNKTAGKIQGIGMYLGGNIQKNLRKMISEPQDSVINSADVISKIKHTLNTVNDSMSMLNGWAAITGPTLADIRNDLATYLTPCSDPRCVALLAESSNISVAADFTLLSPPIEVIIGRLQPISADDLKNEVEMGNETISNITHIVDAAAGDTKREVLDTLDRVAIEIQDFSNKIGLSDYVAELNRSLAEIQNDLATIEQDAVEIDKLRFLAVLGLVLLLSFIVLLFVLGLCLGTFGHSGKKSPAHRGCCSNSGGILLMAAVGFVFIFSWILMLFVALLFFAGGNVHALVCKPLADKTMLNFLDGLKLRDQVDNETLLGHITALGSNITFTQVYEDCKSNTALYSSLKMEQFQNLDDLIDIAQHIQNINDHISAINVDLSSVNILDDAGKQIMRDFVNTGVESGDYDAILQEIAKGLVKTDLAAYARQLRDFPPTPPIVNNTALREIAGRLESIHSEMPSGDLALLETSVRTVKDDTENISSKVAVVIAEVERAQSDLAGNSSSIASHETAKYFTFLISDVEPYISWIKRMIRSELGGCLPVANLVDSLHIIGCSCILDSLNAMWFGLGWTLLFMIVGLIFAVKLAKHFRRMKTEDVYDSPVYTSQVNKAFDPKPEEFKLPRAGI